MLKSTGGNVAESFDGRLAGAPVPMAADEMEDLDGLILRPLASAELVENRVAKQATSRRMELVQLEDLGDMNKIAAGLTVERKHREEAAYACQGSKKLEIHRKFPKLCRFPRAETAHIGSSAMSEQALFVSQVIAAILRSPDNVPPQGRKSFNKKAPCSWIISFARPRSVDSPE